MQRITESLFCRIEKRADIGAEKWNAFVEAQPEGWWWHRYEWLDYCLAYRGGSEQSIAVVCGEEKRILAILPLIIENGKFTAGGNPTPFPLWSESELGDTAMKILADYLTMEANLHGIAEGLFMKTPLREYAKTLPEGQDCIEDVSFKSRVIDLRKPEAERWSGIRKSYHQLIRRGGERFSITASGEFSGYQLLHSKQYNSPRSERTYEYQRKWLEAGNAMLCEAANDETGASEGFTYWQIYKNRAYYSSGVYASDNIAHALLWRSLELLTMRGVDTAEIGWHGMQHETEKEKNIAFFKKGFGGEDWPVPCMRWIFRTDANLEGRA